MSADNTDFNFSDIIPLKSRSEGMTSFSQKSDTAKREIAVVAALQILNSHAKSADSNHVLTTFGEYLPYMTKVILDALEGEEQ
ncbi:MAG: hypothetical protein HRU22_13030 [Gammaproteobacteria bacterium]|nr:hypothetical protein [Gammaproteobacteria bacterium]